MRSPDPDPTDARWLRDKLKQEAEEAERLRLEAEEAYTESEAWEKRFGVDQ